jgi:HSP20 family molecular chaperone IbpA
MITNTMLEQIANEVFHARRMSADKNHAAHHSGTPMVETNGEEYVLTRVLPGVKREEVTISAEGTLLTVIVKAKSVPVWGQGYADTSWTYRLGNDADVANADAKHVDGVLTIRVPIVKPKKKTHVIAVN